MTGNRPRTGSLRANLRAIALATLGAVAISWGLNYLLLFADGLSAFDRSAITATVLPVLLAGPLLAYALSQRERARGAERQITRAATYDPVTGCMRGAVLSGAIEERRKRVAPGGPEKGALLLLAPDGLSRINASFGPEWSSSALALVAQAIRSSIRSGDVVGRLETGEFGLFLPGATEEDAERIGRRVLDAIAAVYFAPGGVESAIEARVAGIVFQHQISFAEMVRRAGNGLITLQEDGPGTIRLEAVDATVESGRH